MIKKICVCDRCGKEIEPHLPKNNKMPRNEDPKYKVASISIIDRTENENEPLILKYDFCSNCNKKFEEFLLGGN